MKPIPHLPFPLKTAVLLLIVAGFACAQAPSAAQTDAPVSTAKANSAATNPDNTETIIVPTGTRIGVVLESGISTATAKPGDSVYFRTSFPITINNKIVIPVGSYLRGEVVDAKRPGRVKGKGEFRVKLDTLVFPNGYTVNMNAAPHSADGGQVKTDQEGKMTGPAGTRRDAGMIATTTATGAGIGAIAGRGEGAGIGAGAGGLVGLGAVLLTRGPEAQLPRGSTMDLRLEHDLVLDAHQIHYRHVGEGHAPILQQ
ncbi:MAG TPA: hypothetical protein VMU05_01875 [Dongiaceae bacterium]|nr:hypothetical protein [Dongiaceae bacterium]